jgi:hypothetical protein
LFVGGSEAVVKLEQLFESIGYTKKGKWVGLSGKKSELLAAYYSLRSFSLLNPGYITRQATAFYHHFGLEILNYISERMLRIEPTNQDREEFDLLFQKTFHTN